MTIGDVGIAGNTHTTSSSFRASRSNGRRGFTHSRRTSSLISRRKEDAAASVIDVIPSISSTVCGTSVNRTGATGHDDDDDDPNTSTLKRAPLASFSSLKISSIDYQDSDLRSLGSDSVFGDSFLDTDEEVDDNQFSSDEAADQIDPTVFIIGPPSPVQGEDGVAGNSFELSVTAAGERGGGRDVDGAAVVAAENIVAVNELPMDYNGNAENGNTTTRERDGHQPTDANGCRGDVRNENDDDDHHPHHQDDDEDNVDELGSSQNMTKQNW